MTDPVGDSMNEALFQRAVAITLVHEGGDAIFMDPLGGLTKWGIAANENPQYTPDQIKALTQDDALNYYRTKWWAPFHWSELPPDVACKCFDIAVDIGSEPLIHCLQRACWAAGSHVKEDGVLGMLTITAANDANPTALLPALKSECAAHYRLVEQNKGGAAANMLNGWLNRAYS